MTPGRRSWLPVAVLVAAACGGPDRGPMEEMEVASPPSVQPPSEAGVVVVALSDAQAARLGIRTVDAQARPVQFVIGIPGSVQPAPDYYAEVSAPISGRVVRILAHEGERVRQGALLAEVESLELANLVAEVLQAQAEHDYQQGQVERFETLVERRIRPASTLAKARADLARAGALLTAAHARLHAIGVTDGQLEAWGSSENQRPLMEVRAPLSGVIAEHRIELGQSVTAYQTMMTLIDPARVLIQGFLDPSDADVVREGDPVQVRSEAGSGRELQAAVRTINPSLAAGSRAVTVNVIADTDSGWPIPGQTVRLEIGVETATPVFAIPLSAIEYEGERATVFVERDPLHWERKTVRLGRVTEDAAFVLEGLESGDRVAVTQVFALKALARFEQYGEAEEG